MNSVFSQPDSENGSQNKLTSSGGRRRKFQPPLKRSEEREEVGSGRVHTVLSYCEEDMDTQPLSMFSGETREREMEGESGHLDDLFLQLDDPFSVQGNTQSSQCSKLDDSLTKLDDPLTKLDDTLTKLDGPVTELDDPFSVSQDTNPTTTRQTSKQDDRIAGLDDQIAELDDPFDDVESEVEEQMVPESPSSSCAPQNCPEEEGEREGGREEGEEEMEDTETRKVPRRRFRGRHNRQYNLELLPHQFRRPTLAPSRGRRGRRGRQRVNWASRVSVCEERETASLETAAAAAGADGKALSVFEVPLSVGEEGGGRRGEGEGGRGRGDQEMVRENRSNLSVSGLDLSNISRTREQQLVIDSEVLTAISRTRDEIRVLRARHTAMMSSFSKITSFHDNPNNYSYLHHHYHKAQSHTLAVKRR